MKKNLILALALSIFQHAVGQKRYMNVDYEYNDNIVPYKARVLEALDSLLLYKDSVDYVVGHFTKTDQKLWGETELYKVFRRSGVRYNEKWELVKDYFKPTVLGIIDIVPAKKYLMKVAYISRDDSIHNSLQHVYNFVANYDSVADKVEFEMFTNWYVRDWYKTQVGEILFYKQDKNQFSIKEATEFSLFNDSVAHLFNMKVKSFVYFSCKDPIQLYNLKGYDFIESMFWARNGGLCVHGGKDSIYQNLIFSANNKEIYNHEMVHYYITSFNDEVQSTKLADEGMATFLGGSAEWPLEHHLTILKKYVEENHSDMTEFFYLNRMKMIDADVSTLYATGGLIAKLVYEKKGLNGWKQFLKIPEEKFKEDLPKLLELKNVSLNDYLKRELEKY